MLLHLTLIHLNIWDSYQILVTGYSDRQKQAWSPGFTEQRENTNIVYVIFQKFFLNVLSTKIFGNKLYFFRAFLGSQQNCAEGT